MEDKQQQKDELMIEALKSLLEIFAALEVEEMESEGVEENGK